MWQQKGFVIVVLLKITVFLSNYPFYSIYSHWMHTLPQIYIFLFSKFSEELYSETWIEDCFHFQCNKRSISNWNFCLENVELYLWCSLRCCLQKKNWDNIFSSESGLLSSIPAKYYWFTLFCLFLASSFYLYKMFFWTEHEKTQKFTRQQQLSYSFHFGGYFFGLP